MTQKTPPRRYRIFPAYMNADGFVVKEGEYFEYEINIDEARQRSTAVLVNASDFSSIKDFTPTPDVIVNSTGNFDLTFTPTLTKPEVKKLKINSCAVKEIEDLKFIGKVSANKITEYRKNAKISSYTELDTVAPIKNKKWEDIVVIDFESGHGLVYKGLETFGYAADNIVTQNATEPTTSESVTSN